GGALGGRGRRQDHTAGDRRAHRDEVRRRGRRPVLHGADAAGRPGGHRSHRRRGERGDPRRPDPRSHRRGRPQAAPRVQGIARRGAEAVIPRYTLPEMAAVWTDERRLSNWLRIEVLACEAWAELGRIPQEDLDAIRERASFTVD